MKVTLGGKGGRIVRSLAAGKVTPLTVDAEVEGMPLGEDPEADEPKVTPAERWERLIGEELGEEEPEPVAAAAPEPPSPLEQAFAVMGRLVDAVAARPQPPAPVVHVHNHDPDLSVNVHPAAGPHVNVTLPDPEPPQVTVENHNHLPGQEPPQVAVTVEAAEAPDVHVQVAAPEVRVEPPQVTVEAAAAPEVHVTVERPPRPAAVRMEIDEDGTRRFVPEDEGDQDA